jgi:PKD repeat protein
LANPTHTYTDPGVYNVKLIATSAYGCQHIEIKSSYITINAQPQAQFTANTTSACDVNTVFHFSATTPGITSWAWDLGDGQTSNQQNPSHQYSNAGNYNVSLIVTNSNGCSDTLSRPNYINIGSALVPSFTMSDTAGCNPLPINFNCTVPNATSWAWNFGDGTTASTQSPSHTYTIPGSYSITLTVTTQSGCNGTVTVPNFVVVDQLPVPDFSVVSDTGCAPFTAQMINLSTGASSYNWAFGNATTSTATNATTTFTQGGYFSVTLTAISPNGCPVSLTKVQLIKVYAPIAGFQATPKIGCPGMTVQFTNTSGQPNIISYFWTFGDGTTSTLQNPTHTYNSIGSFPISLIIENSFGCRDTVYRANYINVVSPLTNYTIPDTVKICLGDPYVFVDPTIGSNIWNWNFGDGGTSHDQNPSHTYNTVGFYTVTLNTSMAGGCIQNFNPFAYVLVIPYAKKPINLNLTSPCKPYNVNFSTATQNVTSYSWSFGDGVTSTLAAPSHTYQNSGTYNVSLTMVVGAGCITQVDTTITLGHQNPTQASTYSECVGNNVAFSVNDSLPFVSAVWHFADGTTAPYFNYSHTYSVENNYAAYLVTIDNFGCHDTFFTPLPITINDPDPDFSVANTNVCFGSSVTFINNSNSGDLYYWDFGDGTSSTDSVPTHTYTTPGTFTVSLTVTKGACTKTKTLTNYINVIDPVAHLTYTTNGMCMPVTVTFTSIAPTAVQWTWLFGNGDSSNLQNPVYTYYNTPTDSLTLIIMDANGCYKTVKEQNIDYYNSAMSVDYSSGCTPLAVQFTDISNGALTWNWSFGDGDTSTLQNPSHTYTTNGTYDVMLICTFPSGCTDTTFYNDFITSQTPTSDFFSPSVAACSPTQINFTNTSTDATIFEWDFGDGGSSTSINPSHIYYIPGYYTIRLISTNSFGCKDTMVKPNYIFIPGTYSNFSVSSTQGCQNLLTTFSDSSINATSWSWNFGDGYVDNVKNPTHMYQDTGTYIVTLITQDTLGCSSSFTYPTPIRIFQTPISSASSTSMGGCSDFTTSFVNSSLYADTYYWEFGTGDTSTLSDPTYTYTSGGNYFPMLVSITNNGCRDTFNFNNPISVLQTPTALIGLSDTSACNPATITFTGQSINTIGEQHDWTFGNGATGTGMIIGNQYTTPGNYVATLVTTNNNGCSDTTTANLTILVSPLADATTNTTTGCNPLAIDFTNLSTGGANYLWQFGNGDGSNSFDTSIVYTQAGIYSPYLVVYNALGCTDTAFLPSITVNQSPEADFYSNDTMACKGSIVSFYNTSTNLISPTYNWNLATSTNVSFNPVTSYVYSGDYDISLVVTNSNGCTDTMTKVAYINVADSLPPPADPILSVSVVDDSSVDITWQNSSASDLKYYEVYRLNASTNNYDLIYHDANAKNSTAALTSTYRDTALDTRNNTYTYKVLTIDYCDNKLSLSALTPHTTIDITALQAGANIFVRWTPYVGCTVNTYDLYRTEVSSGLTQFVASVPSTQLNYLDTSLSCPFDYSYKVTATDLCGNTYISNSDTSVARPLNILAAQQVSVIRSTVIDNKDVLTEWLPPTIHPERVLEYQIYRSEDNSTFNLVAIVPAALTSYTDLNASINEQEYYYRILVVNDCNISGIESNRGSSILLTGSHGNYSTQFNWTPYKEWQPGVDTYQLERINANGVWEIIKVVDGTVTNTTIDE